MTGYDISLLAPSGYVPLLLLVTYQLLHFRWPLNILHETGNMSISVTLRRLRVNIVAVGNQ